MSTFLQPFYTFIAISSENGSGIVQWQPCSVVSLYLLPSSLLSFPLFHVRAAAKIRSTQLCCVVCVWIDLAFDVSRKLMVEPARGKCQPQKVYARKLISTLGILQSSSVNRDCRPISTFYAVATNSDSLERENMNSWKFFPSPDLSRLFEFDCSIYFY